MPKKDRLPIIAPPPSFADQFIVDTYRGRTRIRPRHTPHPIKPGSPRAKSAELFRLMVWAMKQWFPDFWAACVTAAKGTSWYPRDIMLCAMYGRLVYLILPDGTEIYPMVARRDVSRALDVLGKTVGQMLVRGDTYWEQIDLFTTDFLTALLDTITSTQGNILKRGASDWEAYDLEDPANISAILDLITDDEDMMLIRGASAWTATPKAGIGAWSLIQSGTFTGSPTSITVTNLPLVSQMFVAVYGVTASVSGQRQLLLSTNNGSSYYNTIGDYNRRNSDGTGAQVAFLPLHLTGATAARNGSMYLLYPGTTLTPKQMFSPSGGSNALHDFTGDGNPVNAIKISNSGGGTLGPGTATWYVWGA